MPTLLALDGWNEVFDMLDLRDSGISGVEAKQLELEIEPELSKDGSRGNAGCVLLTCDAVNGIFTECLSSAFWRRT